MIRNNRKYHFIYKTTNVLNGKFYIGMHSTDNLNDGYLGSGKYIANSIRKYGKENFKIEFIEFYPTRDALIQREIELVNDDILKDLLCMNLGRGGHGGWMGNKNSLSILLNKKVRKLNVIKSKITRKNRTKKRKIQLSKTISNGLIKHWKLNGHNWEGRKHSQETIKKMKSSHQKRIKIMKNQRRNQEKNNKRIAPRVT